MIKEQFSGSKPVLAIAATSIVTDTTTYGEWIDTQNYRSLTIPLDFDWTTDGQIDSVGFQGSNDVGHADAADLDDAENLYYPGSFPVTADALIHVGCVAKDRYVRLKIVSTEHTAGSIAIPKTAGLLQDSVVKPQVKESSVVADADMVMPSSTGDAVTTPPKRTA